MLRSVRCALAMALVLAALGCVSDASEGNTGGSGGTGATGGSGGSGTHQDAGTSPAADSGAAPDATTGPPQSCREVRVCIHNCGQDMTCAGKCVSTAPPAIRQQYEEILACSTGVCAASDEPCRCDQECFNMGQCFDLVEECDQGVGDPWCEIRCH